MADDDAAMLPLSFKVPATIKAGIEAAATAQLRSLTGQATHYIREGLRRDGFLVDVPHSVRGEGA